MLKTGEISARELGRIARGKRLSDGSWVTGYYAWLPSSAGAGHLILARARDPDESNQTFQVDPETVSLCTGLLDRNGVMIFEGDVLRVREDEGAAAAAALVRYGEYHEEDSLWPDDAALGWHVELQPLPGKYTTLLQCFRDGCGAEVAGNIWDTPELMAGPDG